MDTVQSLETPRRPAIAEAQTAVRGFLEAALPEVRRVNITKVAPATAGGASWEAEAEVWQPNATLEALGLATERPVLDHSHYMVRLDALLNVLEYELEGSADKKVL
jgi:hypothetical protein